MLNFGLKLMGYVFFKSLNYFFLGLVFALNASDGLKDRDFDFKVVDRNCREFSLVQDTFNTVISQWYGSQESALERVGAGRDRLCEMLFDNNEPKGIIVYKKEPQDEALECKTLCLLNPTGESGKGYGKVLLNRLVETATRRSVGKINLSVSSKNPAKSFFLSKGFEVTQSLTDKYVKGETEDFLSYRISGKEQTRTPSVATNAASTTSSFSRKDFSATGSHSAPTVSVSHREFTRTSSNTQQRDSRGFFSSIPSEGRGVMHSSTTLHQRMPDIKCTLKREFINAIRSGGKTYEGRVNTSFFRGYTPGKIVEWYCGQDARDKVVTEIISRTTHKSFEDMLTNIGYKKFLPTAHNLEYAKSLYDSIPGYPEKVAINGALALELRVVNLADLPPLPARSHYYDRDERYDRGDNDSRKRKTEEYVQNTGKR